MQGEGRRHRPGGVRNGGACSSSSTLRVDTSGACGHEARILKPAEGSKQDHSIENAKRSAHRETPRGPLVTLPDFRDGVSARSINGS